MVTSDAGRRLREHLPSPTHVLFERIFDEGLAHASYILACERTRQAIVIDPRRDVDVYVDYARPRRLTITYSIDTHIHADFVSGSRELARTGAQIVSGPESDLQFDHRSVADDERWELGELRLRFLHTPGHTPEHICILVDADGEPTRLFSGDTLFVGAVGRPDLLGDEWTRGLAGDLYDSLFHKLLALDDDVEVHPAHGAGSLCGRAIGTAPSSTIGAERRGNPLLQPQARSEFATTGPADLPEAPPYFRGVKQMNTEGPPVLGLVRPPALPDALTPLGASALLQTRGILIDMREAGAFGAGHPPRALNIGFGARVGYWAGWVVPLEARLVLLAEKDEQISEAVRQLLRVGFDNLAGFVAGGFDRWRDTGFPVSTIGQIPADEVHARLAEGAPLRVVDVRSSDEWDAGHLDEAIHIPVAAIAGAAESLRSETSPIAVMCESGYRASLAASLLARAGVPSVMNVAGGMSTFRTIAD